MGAVQGYSRPADPQPSAPAHPSSSAPLPRRRTPPGFDEVCSRRCDRHVAVSPRHPGAAARPDGMPASSARLPVSANVTRTKASHRSSRPAERPALACPATAQPWHGSSRPSMGTGASGSARHLRRRSPTRPCVATAVHWPDGTAGIKPITYGRRLPPTSLPARSACGPPAQRGCRPVDRRRPPCAASVPAARPANGGRRCWPVRRL